MLILLQIITINNTNNYHPSFCKRLVNLFQQAKRIQWCEKKKKKKREAC
uniref:Uncharacterized protein n=1 Tax=Rhizophora mucronata TaxID=61149 RepID=A0A2P2KJ19_RHIMU